MIIECPKCHKALEIAAEMEGEYVQCYSCETSFVATKWSGVVLSDAMLERYLIEHEYEKKERMIYGCFDDSVKRLARSRLGVSSAIFRMETAGVFEEEETGGEDSQAMHPYEGVYVLARLENTHEIPKPSVALQEFIEATIGYRVELVHEEKCLDVHRNYIRYFVHFDAPCRRTIFPTKAETESRDWRKDREKGRLRIIDFEYHRTEDLLCGNIIEHIYVEDFRCFRDEVCRQYGVTQLVVNNHDKPFNASYDKIPGNPEIKERPEGVTIRIRLDSNTPIVANDLLDAISRRLGRKLRFLGCFMGDEFDYYVETPLPHIASPEVKSLAVKKEVVAVSSVEELIGFWINCPTLGIAGKEILRCLRMRLVMANSSAERQEVLDEIESWAKKHHDVTGM